MVSDIFTLYVRIHKAAAAAGETALQADALGEPRRAWPAGGTSSPRPRSARSRGFPARPRSNRPSTWPPPCGPGTQGGAAAGDAGLLAAARRAVSLAQGLCPGDRDAAGPPRSGGGHGAAGAMAQPGRRDSAGRGGLLVPRPGAAVDGGPLAERPGGRPRRHRSVRQPPGRKRLTSGAAERWPLARKFLDYLEANAEEYWQVPRFEMAAEVLGDERRRGRRRRRTTTKTTSSARPTST